MRRGAGDWDCTPLHWEGGGVNYTRQTSRRATREALASARGSGEGAARAEISDIVCSQGATRAVFACCAVLCCTVLQVSQLEEALQHAQHVAAGATQAADAAQGALATVRRASQQQAWEAGQAVQQLGWELQQVRRGGGPLGSEDLDALRGRWSVGVGDDAVFQSASSRACGATAGLCPPRLPLPRPLLVPTHGCGAKLHTTC